MYLPTFTLTHTLVQHLIDFELSLRDLKTMPISIKIQRHITSSLGQKLIKNLSTELGKKVSDNSALDLYLGKEMPPAGSELSILSNFRSVMDYVYASAKDPYALLSPALLLHLNKLLLNEVLESWEHGRFRSLTDEPDERFDPWLKEIQPPPLDNDPHRDFLDLFVWYSDKKHMIHPLLKIGVVLHELLLRYPFISGNFLTTLALGELLIERSKYSLRNIQLLSNAFLTQSEELKEQLKPDEGQTNDATAWLEVFIRALSTEALAVRNEAVRLSDRKLRASKDDLAELNTRQLKLIRYFRYHPRISRKLYVSQSGVSTMTAYRDLNDLVKRSMIVQKGGGRSTYYELRHESHDIEEKIEESQSSRPIVKVIKDSEYSDEDSGFSELLLR